MQLFDSSPGTCNSTNLLETCSNTDSNNGNDNKESPSLKKN